MLNILQSCLRYISHVHYAIHPHFYTVNKYAQLTDITNCHIAVNGRDWPLSIIISPFLFKLVKQLPSISLCHLKPSKYSASNDKEDQIKISSTLEERGVEAGKEMVGKPKIWERLYDPSGQLLYSVYFFLLKIV